MSIKVLRLEADTSDTALEGAQPMASGGFFCCLCGVDPDTRNNMYPGLSFGRLCGGERRVLDAFAIAARSDVAPGARIASDVVVPAGFSDPSPISVSGDGSPAIVIDGGIETAADVLTPGSGFAVVLDAPATADGTARRATVDLGSVTASFDIRTADLLPDDFDFDPVADADGDALVAASAATITGISEPVEASVTGDGSPALSVNGGPWTSPVTVADGDGLNVRLTSPAADGTTRTAFVTVGLGAARFEVTTSDEVPDALVFTARTSVDLDTEIVSNPVAISGIDAPVAISVAGDGSPAISIDSGPWIASGTISPGQSVRVRLTSGASSSATHTATVTAGGVPSYFQVTTGDAAPAAFAFAAKTAQPLDALIVSDPATISGIDIASPVSVTGVGNPQIQIAGGAWASSGSITNGQTIRVRLTSANAEAATRTATVAIGGVPGTFSVTTADTTPNNFAFNAQTGAALSTLVMSNTVTISGIDTGVPVSVSGNGTPGISINGGGWVASGTISSGQTLRVRLTSSAAGTTTHTATVTVGSMPRDFSVTTGAAGSACQPFVHGYSYMVRHSSGGVHWGTPGMTYSAPSFNGSPSHPFFNECKQFCESFAGVSFCQYYIDGYGANCMAISNPGPGYSIAPVGYEGGSSAASCSPG